jgi:hypothetical protein
VRPAQSHPSCRGEPPCCSGRDEPAVSGWYRLGHLPGSSPVAIGETPPTVATRGAGLGTWASARWGSPARLLAARIRLHG